MKDPTDQTRVKVFCNGLVVHIITQRDPIKDPTDQTMVKQFCNGMVVQIRTQ